MRKDVNRTGTVLTGTEPLSTTAAEEIARVRPAKRHALLVAYHRDGVEVVPLARAVVIGREPPSDIVIQERSLSRRHARFQPGEGTEVVVEDLGSRNGMLLGDKRMDRAALKPGDEVRLGNVIVMYQR